MIKLHHLTVLFNQHLSGQMKLKSIQLRGNDCVALGISNAVSSSATTGRRLLLHDASFSQFTIYPFAAFSHFPLIKEWREAQRDGKGSPRSERCHLNYHYIYLMKSFLFYSEPTTNSTTAASRTTRSWSLRKLYAPLE